MAASVTSVRRRLRHKLRQAVRQISTPQAYAAAPRTAPKAGAAVWRKAAAGTTLTSKPT